MSLTMLKILIMDNDSGDRSNQVQEGENNDSDEQSLQRLAKIQNLCQLSLLHQQKRKRKQNVSSITNQHRHLPQLPAIQVANKESHNDTFKFFTENEKLKLKLPKNMANYANKHFEEYVPEDSLKQAIYYAKTMSKIILAMSRSWTIFQETS